MIKKRDIILALVLILLGIVCYGVIRLGQKKGSQVIIYEDQKEIGRYDLNTDTTKEIQTAKGMNILEIKNGMAYVTVRIRYASVWGRYQRQEKISSACRISW